MDGPCQPCVVRGPALQVLLELTLDPLHCTDMALADRSAAGSPSAAAPFLAGAAGAGAGAGAYAGYDNPAPAFAQSGHRESYSTLDMATAEPMGYATPDYGNGGSGVSFPACF